MRKQKISAIAIGNVEVPTRGHVVYHDRPGSLLDRALRTDGSRVVVSLSRATQEERERAFFSLFSVAKPEPTKVGG